MKKQLSKIFSNEFYKGGIILTASSILVNFFNYIFNFLAGRALGPAGYGEISSLFSYVSLLTIPTAVVTTIIIQKIGSTDQEKLPYALSIEAYINQKLKKYAPIIILSLLLTPFIHRITNLSPLTSAVLIPFILIAVLTSFYNSMLQGLKLFFFISLISLAITFLKMFGGIAAALHMGGVEVVLLFLFIASIVGYAGNIIALRVQSKKAVTLEPAKKIEKRMLSFILSPQFITTGLSVAAMLALNNVDIIYVKKFFSPQEAGLYSSWSLFAKAIFYVLGPLLGVSYIFFTHTKDRHDEQKSFILSLLALIGLGICSFIFYTFFADFIISTLFGKKFVSIIPYLGLASIYGSLYAIITFINNFFIAKKSKYSLILALSLPIYVVALFFTSRNIANIFILNILYGTVTVSIYLLAYFYSKNKL